MTKKDERIQQWLDKHLPEDPQTGDDSMELDFKAYQLVFGALKSEPAEGLSYGLSFRVQRLIFKNKQKARQKLLYALLAFAGIILVTGAVIIGKSPLIANLPHILPGIYFWPICFGTASVVLIQLFEHRRLRKKWLTSRRY